ncbi:hypothetical protein ACOMHN_029293 [Nucella lapillus]
MEGTGEDSGTQSQWKELGKIAALSHNGGNWGRFRLSVTMEGTGEDSGNQSRWREPIMAAGVERAPSGVVTSVVMTACPCRLLPAWLCVMSRAAQGGKRVAIAVLSKPRHLATRMAHLGGKMSVGKNECRQNDCVGKTSVGKMSVLAKRVSAKRVSAK